MQEGGDNFFTVFFSYPAFSHLLVSEFVLASIPIFYYICTSKIKHFEVLIL